MTTVSTCFKESFHGYSDGVARRNDNYGKSRDLSSWYLGNGPSLLLDRHHLGESALHVLVA